jgi:hypothetical protein
MGRFSLRELELDVNETRWGENYLGGGELGNRKIADRTKILAGGAIWKRGGLGRGVFVIFVGTDGVAEVENP